LLGGGHRRLQRFPVPHVDPYLDGPGAFGPDAGGHFLQAVSARQDRHVGSLLGQELGRGGADAAAGTGDQRVACFETTHDGPTTRPPFAQTGV